VLWHTAVRDTKTALLIFNRTKNLSGVAGQVPGAVRAHPNFVRDLGQVSETEWRFTLHHRDDPERQLLLAVLLFEVPA